MAGAWELDLFLSAKKKKAERIKSVCFFTLRGQEEAGNITDVVCVHTSHSHPNVSC